MTRYADPAPTPDQARPRATDRVTPPAGRPDPAAFLDHRAPRPAQDTHVPQEAPAC